MKHIFEATVINDPLINTKVNNKEVKVLFEKPEIVIPREPLTFAHVPFPFRYYREDDE